jgi:hypothetical protein
MYLHCITIYRTFCTSCTIPLHQYRVRRETLICQGVRISQPRIEDKFMKCKIMRLIAKDKCPDPDSAFQNRTIINPSKIVLKQNFDVFVNNQMVFFKRIKLGISDHFSPLKGQGYQMDWAF